MALRIFGSTRLRHPAGRRRRLAFTTAAIVVFALGAISATWPAVLHFRSDFLSGGAPGHGEASPGDHLQTLYHWWLVGHQLEHGHAPWLDPYSFRPEASEQPNYPGWPFGFLYWPLSAAFGAVVGWNLVQLILYVLAGSITCAWLRELGLARAPAIAGGLAFALAPYRMQQSVGHLLGPISMLLPLSLWAYERARRGSPAWLVLSAVALASIPLSGQVHLALGAIPFFIAYTLVRRPSNRLLLGGAAACVAAAVGAGVLVQQTVIAHSTQATGRSLNQVSVYSARFGDFLARNVDHARSEQFVYLGWATPLLALAGLVLLIRARRFAFAALLGFGVLIPVVLALGTHLPTYAALWHALPPFRFPRVPERLLPIACLCLGALVAFSLARASAVLVVVVLALLFVDLHARVYGKSAPGNPPQIALASGRLLELPVFDPGVHYGSVYLWYDTVSQRERPGGYSTTAPLGAKALARRLERLNCGDWSGDTEGLLRRLGVTTIELHYGLFLRNSAVPNRSGFALLGLLTHGWNVRRRDGAVSIFTPGNSRPEFRSGAKRGPVFCEGWYGNTGSGWPMSETHAPFWIYGSGRMKLRFAPSSLARSFTVDGRRQDGPTFRLGKRNWHVIAVDVPHLVDKVGLRLIGITFPSSGIRSRRTGSSP
jgi:hypothetical protein